MAHPIGGWMAEMVRALPDDGKRPEILADTLAWQVDPGHPPLELDVPAYFSDVLGKPD